MPQVSASIDNATISVISELAAEVKPFPLSFSTMVKVLLATHPDVIKKSKDKPRK